MGLSSSCMGRGLKKKGESSMTSISILMLGHLPILSLRLKAIFMQFYDVHESALFFSVQI